MNAGRHLAECAFVDTWLDDWIAGRAADVVARRVEAHLPGCPRCRKLLAVVRDADARPAGTEDDDLFLAEVLRQTTGPACTRAETLLPALADDELDRDSRNVLDGHLAHCQSCRRLLETLREARQVLPAMASIEPPAGFTQQVLRVTTAGEPRSTVGQWFMRLLARPRASLELAYVATVLLVVLFGNPVAAFHGAEQQANRLAATAPIARLAARLPVKDATAGTIGGVLAPLRAVANQVAEQFSDRWRQGRALIDEIEATVGHALRWLATLDVRTLFNGGSQTGEPRGRPTPGSHLGDEAPGRTGRK